LGVGVVDRLAFLTDDTVRGNLAMTGKSRRAFVYGLAIATLSIGCSPASFVIGGLLRGERESKKPAEYALKMQPKHEDVKVIVLVSAKSYSFKSPDMFGTDRKLNAELISALDERCRLNEEQVLVLKMPRIDQFKTDNPNWRSMNPHKIGKREEFHADYVIDVEIVELDLFKPDGRKEWLKGNANISIAAYDINKPLEEPAYKKDYHIEYPTTREIPVESPASVTTFRDHFVKRIAEDIANLFTSSTNQRRID
jgi:hypothetical protein